MDATKLEAARAALTARRGEIIGDLARLDQEMQWLGSDQQDESGGLGNHLAEDGSSVSEAERIESLAEDLRDLLRQIDGALARMERGRYGICQRCGKPIAAERLEAFPYVEFCIECQSTLERQRALYGASVPRAS
jgi:DnaK suppressor protein